MLSEIQPPVLINILPDVVHHVILRFWLALDQALRQQKGGNSWQLSISAAFTIQLVSRFPVSSLTLPTAVMDLLATQSESLPM